MVKYIDIIRIQENAGLSREETVAVTVLFRFG